MDLLIATTNPGKLREIEAILERVPVTLHTLSEFPGIEEPEETGATFAANARLKAEYYSLQIPGQLVLADDSGLEVPALLNEPGVRSARYADDANFLPGSQHSTDERNNLLLLDRMAGITHRDARYRCVLSLARDGSEILSSVGEVPGEILSAPRGTGGFGYDPLFYLPQLGKTMAQIDLNTKHHLSHRGAALRALLARTQQFAPGIA